jgi:hypothetical protein
VPTTKEAEKMGVAKKAMDAYNLFKKGKKIYGYGKLVKDAVDENTRPGAIAKLGIKAMLEIAGKAIGTSLTSHPYFTYHKAHLEALAQALNASSNFDAAATALNRAIRSADASDALAASLSDYIARKNSQKLSYVMFIGGSLKLLADYSPEGEKQLREVNQTRDALRASTDQNIYEWRALLCDVYNDSVQLLAMAEVELQSTRAAMQKFNEKMKAMQSGGNIGKVMAYQTEQNRQWQEYDRMTTPGVGDAKAVEDPTAYAQDRLDRIETVSNALAAVCDAAMSDDAYKPDKLALRIGTL